GETTGSVQDWASDFDATRGTGLTGDRPGAIVGDTDRATTFTTANGSFASTTYRKIATNHFTVEAWVRTTSTTGGRIVGLSANQTGTSGSRDRHIYMDRQGRLFFGAYPGSYRTVSSGSGFNDGQ